MKSNVDHPGAFDEQLASRMNKISKCLTACEGMNDPIAEIALLRLVALSENKKLTNDIEGYFTSMTLPQ